MAKKTLVEGIILVGLGFLSIIEGVRLAIRMRQPGFYDVVGPDRYAMGIGFLLVVAGAIYVFSQMKEKRVIKEPAADKEGEEKKTLVKVVGIVGVVVLYGFLMTIIGYFLASIVFFVLVCKILGVKSWLFNIIFSVAVTVIYQLIFGNFLGVILPQGYININIPNF